MPAHFAFWFPVPSYPTSGRAEYCFEFTSENGIKSWYDWTTGKATDAQFSANVMRSLPKLQRDFEAEPKIALVAFPTNLIKHPAVSISMFAVSRDGEYRRFDTFDRSAIDRVFETQDQIRPR